METMGIVGGIACGKTAVAKMFQSLGAAHFDADHIGHQVLKDAEVVSAIRARWGDQVMTHGDVDRSALAKIVFTGPHCQTELAFLEQLTHPRIREKLDEQLDRARQSGCPLAVIDAAVMLKSEWEDVCDYLLYIEAPRATRLQRARSRGWTEQEFNARESAQLPLSQKRARADFIIDNSTTLETTFSQVQSIWDAIGGPTN